MGAEKTRLTTLAHGGGCGCKLAPSVLRELLAEQNGAGHFATCSSARRPATTPRSGGSTTRPASSRPPTSSCRWSTTRSISAGSPRPTRSRTSTPWAAGRSSRSRSSGMPIGRMSIERSARFLRGGAGGGADAGIPVAGGHSIDSPEPIYGLAVIGLVAPENLRRNCDARPGDALILTKPIGVGIYSAAIKKGALTRRAATAR